MSIRKELSSGVSANMRSIPRLERIGPSDGPSGSNRIYFLFADHSSTIVGIRCAPMKLSGLPHVRVHLADVAQFRASYEGSSDVTVYRGLAISPLLFRRDLTALAFAALWSLD
jgi:hypothetical protein